MRLSQQAASRSILGHFRESFLLDAIFDRAHDSTGTKSSLCSTQHGFFRALLAFSKVCAREQFVVARGASSACERGVNRCFLVCHESTCTYERPSRPIGQLSSRSRRNNGSRLSVSVDTPVAACENPLCRESCCVRLGWGYTLFINLS
jgi:hypothetical protein